MIADFRRKPSRARRQAARRELEAYIDLELAKLSATRIGFDPGVPGAITLEQNGNYEVHSTRITVVPEPKEPLPMLEQPKREVTAFRGGKWEKPEKERQGKPNSALRHRDEKRRRT